MVQQAEAVAAVGCGQLVAVDVVEHIDVDEVQPAVVLVEVNQRGLYVLLKHLASHALVGPQVVEAAHGGGMSDRGCVLAVVVAARTAAHTARGEVVQAGGVVVAVGPAGLVVRVRRRKCRYISARGYSCL